MLQPAGDLGLEQEPLAAGRVVGVLVEDLLEGHLAVQLAVAARRRRRPGRPGRGAAGCGTAGRRRWPCRRSRWRSGRVVAVAGRSSRRPEMSQRRLDLGVADPGQARAGGAAGGDRGQALLGARRRASSGAARPSPRPRRGRRRRGRRARRGARPAAAPCRASRPGRRRRAGPGRSGRSAGRASRRAGCGTGRWTGTWRGLASGRLCVSTAYGLVKGCEDSVDPSVEGRMHDPIPDDDVLPENSSGLDPCTPRFVRTPDALRLGRQHIGPARLGPEMAALAPHARCEIVADAGLLRTQPHGQGLRHPLLGKGSVRTRSRSLIHPSPSSLAIPGFCARDDNEIDCPFILTDLPTDTGLELSALRAFINLSH